VLIVASVAAPHIYRIGAVSGHHRTPNDRGDLGVDGDPFAQHRRDRWQRQIGHDVSVPRLLTALCRELPNIA
jgi:hypothetical protein